MFKYMDGGFHHKVVLTGCKDFLGKLIDELSVQSIWDEYQTRLGGYDSFDHKQLFMLLEQIFFTDMTC